MRFEHCAINVSDPVAMAAWYVANVGFNIVRHVDAAPFTRFLADDSGRTVLELYNNPKGAVPDYASQHPTTFHLAVVAKDAGAERDRLLAAGATVAVEEPLPDGSLLIMMRDPWGVCLQLCQRVRPMPT